VGLDVFDFRIVWLDLICLSVNERFDDAEDTIMEPYIFKRAEDASPGSFGKFLVGIDPSANISKANPSWPGHTVKLL